MEKKTGKPNLKFKNFYSLKDTVKKMKRQATNGEKIFAKYVWKWTYFQNI